MDATNVRAGSEAVEETLPCGMTIDKEGDWYYEGSRIVREDILGLFYDGLHYTPDGKFLVDLPQGRCLLDVADTPFVVSRVDRQISGEGRGEAIVLRFRHWPGVEILDPATLSVGQGHVLYCRIREEKIPARFSRPAYYQLVEWVREDTQTGAFYVEINGIRYEIQSAGQDE